MTERQQTADLTTETSPAIQPAEPKRKPKILFGLEPWEIVVLAISAFLVFCVAIPNYFEYLEYKRGKESTLRLTLLANSLKYLADKNETKPGEKICEIFDLNETLEIAQRHIYDNASVRIPPNLYFRYGIEPDCPAGGDYSCSLYLGADGNIIEPTSTLAWGPDGEYYRERGLCVADMDKVNGDIGL